MRVRALDDRDRGWLRDLVAETWSLPVVSPGRVYDDPSALDGVVAEHDGERLGILTYDRREAEWEVVTLNATVSRRGAATGMMRAVRDAATAAGASRLWLITTDENIGAIAFYEAIGMRRARVHSNFVEVVARYKPAVRGAFRDAIEFEWRLR